MLLAGGGIFYVLRAPSDTQQNNTPPPDTQPPVQQPTEQSQKPPEFNKSLYSLTEPTSVWFIASKHFALPTTYVPNDLTVPEVPLRLAKSEEQMQIRGIVATDLTALFTDAAKNGLQLEFGSGYRSAAYQKQLYTGYVASMGQAEADRSSARPGHSEHQTGLALDFTRIDGKCHLEECFGTLEEGIWLAKSAHTYGFVLRYPQNKEQTTGYIYEPWHYRYVGKELAAELYRTGTQTLEEFFSLAPATNYLQP